MLLLLVKVFEYWKLCLKTKWEMAFFLVFKETHCLSSKVDYYQIKTRDNKQGVSNSTLMVMWQLNGFIKIYNNYAIIIMFLKII